MDSETIKAVATLVLFPIAILFLWWLHETLSDAVVSSLIAYAATMRAAGKFFVKFLFVAMLALYFILILVTVAKLGSVNPVEIKCEMGAIGNTIVEHIAIITVETFGAGVQYILESSVLRGYAASPGVELLREAARYVRWAAESIWQLQASK